MAGKGGTAPTKNGPNTSLPPSKRGKNPQLPPYQTKMFLVPPFCNLFAIFQVPLCWKGVPTIVKENLWSLVGTYFPEMSSI